MGDMLFPNAKRTNLKVSVSPISDLWKRCQCLQAMNKLGKRLGHQGTHSRKCGALRLHDQRGRVFFCTSAFKKAAWTMWW